MNGVALAVVNNIRVVDIIEGTVVVIGTENSRVNTRSKFVLNNHVTCTKRENISAILSKWRRRQAENELRPDGLQYSSVRSSGGVVKLIDNQVVATPVCNLIQVLTSHLNGAERHSGGSIRPPTRSHTMDFLGPEYGTKFFLRDVEDLICMSEVHDVARLHGLCVSSSYSRFTRSRWEDYQARPLFQIVRSRKLGQGVVLQNIGKASLRRVAASAATTL